MPDDAPRLLMIAHATPRPVTDGPEARVWRFVKQLAQRGQLTLLTVIDRPLNQQDWRAIHGVAPDTTLVRRGRLGRYARIPAAIASIADPAPFHLTLLTAPSLLSLRPTLPQAPVAVDLDACEPNTHTQAHAATRPTDYTLVGEPERVAPDLIAALYNDPASLPAARPVGTLRRRAA
ncbi:MAG: hypothetical protein AAGB29_09495 [Planctomycetota bacterium]